MQGRRYHDEWFDKQVTRSIHTLAKSAAVSFAVVRGLWPRASDVLQLVRHDIQDAIRGHGRDHRRDQNLLLLSEIVPLDIQDIKFSAIGARHSAMPTPVLGTLPNRVLLDRD